MANKKKGVIKLLWGFPNFNRGYPWGLNRFTPNFCGMQEWGRILRSVHGD